MKLLPVKAGGDGVDFRQEGVGMGGEGGQGHERFSGVERTLYERKGQADGKAAKKKCELPHKPMESK